MDYSFPRYLLAKQTIDDRALNKDVLAALSSAIRSENSLAIIEVGAGIGTMLTRLLRWNILPPVVEYTLVDELRENTDYALAWIPSWAAQNGYQVETVNANTHRLISSNPVSQSVLFHIIPADVFDFIRLSEQKSDLLIAHAFLDLLPMPESLPKLFSLVKPNGPAWLTINFDGVTSLEPAIDLELDSKIERLYHQTMDARLTGGDSQAGRHLFRHLKQVEAEIISAGASDWVVFAPQGQYPADEAYFLHFILHFFETSLSNHPELDPNLFAAWLAKRRSQIDNGELVYIAHQMDFLCRAPFSQGGGRAGVEGQMKPSPLSDV